MMRCACRRAGKEWRQWPALGEPVALFFAAWTWGRQLARWARSLYRWTATSWSTRRSALFVSAGDLRVLCRETCCRPLAHPWARLGGRCCSVVAGPQHRFADQHCPVGVRLGPRCRGHRQAARHDLQRPRICQQSHQRRSGRGRAHRALPQGHCRGRPQGVHCAPSLAGGAGRKLSPPPSSFVFAAPVLRSTDVCVVVARWTPHGSRACSTIPCKTC
jgi:hypothetical protein